MTLQWPWNDDVQLSWRPSKRHITAIWHTCEKPAPQVHTRSAMSSGFWHTCRLRRLQTDSRLQTDRQTHRDSGTQLYSMLPLSDLIWSDVIWCDVMRCSGQRIDGPQNGSAPRPWDVHCNPTQMFRSEIRHLEVPHTAIVTVRTSIGLGLLYLHQTIDL